MKQKLAVLVAFLSLVIPARLFAKGDISKITIKGADLKTAIEITDFTNFKDVDVNVWAGPGVKINGKEQTEGFIIDWSQTVMEPPKGLQGYEVSFYAKFPDEKLVYVVLYEYDPATERGYIYLPGKGDDSYWLNMGTITHGVQGHYEGHWYRALSGWDRVARPPIESAKPTASSPGLD
jgi:hypothetical protein